MSNMISTSLLPEFDQEIANTRRVLERVTDAMAPWKPHPKSMSAGDLALHLANLIGWASVTMEGTELDFNPPGGPAWKPPVFESAAATLAEFERNVAQGRTALSRATDADYGISWALKNGGATIFALPRVAVIRTFVLNHLIHHRAQLGLYLRLNNLPVPAIYGPSADEGQM